MIYAHVVFILNVPGVCFRRGMMKELVALQESLCHCPNCSEGSSVVSLREGSGVLGEEVGKKLELLFQPFWGPLPRRLYMEPFAKSA